MDNSPELESVDDPFAPYLLHDPDASAKKAIEAYDKKGHSRKFVVYIKPATGDQLHRIAEDTHNIFRSEQDTVRFAIDAYIEQQAYEYPDAEAFAYAAQARAMRELDAAQHKRWYSNRVSETFLRELRYHQKAGEFLMLTTLYNKFLKLDLVPNEALAGFAEQYGLDGSDPASSSDS